MENLIEHNGISTTRLTVDAVRAVLEKHKGEKWFKDNFGFTVSPSPDGRISEVAISISPGHILRYFDPQCASSNKYASQKVKSASLNPSLQKQLIETKALPASRVSTAGAAKSKKDAAPAESRYVPAYAESLAVFFLENDIKGLTDAEIKVIDLILQGKTSSQIGTALSTAKKNIDSHIANIYEKLGVNNRMQMFNRLKTMGYKLPDNGKKHAKVSISKAEYRVLFTITEGFDSTQTGFILECSKRTVDFHLARVYEKFRNSEFDVSTRTGLAVVLVVTELEVRADKSKMVLETGPIEKEVKELIGKYNKREPEEDTVILSGPDLLQPFPAPKSVTAERPARVPGEKKPDLSPATPTTDDPETAARKAVLEERKHELDTRFGKWSKEAVEVKRAEIRIRLSGDKGLLEKIIWPKGIGGLTDLILRSRDNGYKFRRMLGNYVNNPVTLNTFLEDVNAWFLLKLFKEDGLKQLSKNEKGELDNIESACEEFYELAEWEELNNPGTVKRTSTGGVAQLVPFDKPVMMPRGEILPSGETVYEWEWYVFNPTIIYKRFNGHYYMIYRAKSRDKISRLGLAWSDDLISWERLDWPIFTLVSESAEDPHVILSGDKLELYYVDYDGKTFDTHWANADIDEFLKLAESWRKFAIVYEAVKSDRTEIPETEYVKLYRMLADIMKFVSPDMGQEEMRKIHINIGAAFTEEDPMEWQESWDNFRRIFVEKEKKRWDELWDIKGCLFGEGCEKDDVPSPDGEFVLRRRWPPKDDEDTSRGDAGSIWVTFKGDDPKNPELFLEPDFAKGEFKIGGGTNIVKTKWNGEDVYITMMHIIKGRPGDDAYSIDTNPNRRYEGKLIVFKVVQDENSKKHLKLLYMSPESILKPDQPWDDGSHPKNEGKYPYTRHGERNPDVTFPVVFPSSLVLAKDEDDITVLSGSGDSVISGANGRLSALLPDKFITKTVRNDGEFNYNKINYSLGKKYAGQTVTIIPYNGKDFETGFRALIRGVEFVRQESGAKPQYLYTTRIISKEGRFEYDGKRYGIGEDWAKATVTIIPHTEGDTSGAVRIFYRGEQLGYCDTSTGKFRHAYDVVTVSRDGRFVFMGTRCNIGKAISAENRKLKVTPHEPYNWDKGFNVFNNKREKIGIYDAETGFRIIYPLKRSVDEKGRFSFRNKRYMVEDIYIGKTVILEPINGDWNNGFRLYCGDKEIACSNGDEASSVSEKTDRASTSGFEGQGPVEKESGQTPRPPAPGIHLLRRLLDILKRGNPYADDDISAKDVAEKDLEKVLRMLKDKDRLVSLEEALGRDFRHFNKEAARTLDGKDILDESRSQYFLKDNVFVVKNTSGFPSWITSSLVRYGVFHAPDANVNGSTGRGIVIVLYDLVANNIRYIKHAEKRREAMNLLWGLILASMLSIEHGTKYFKAMDQAAGIIGVSRAYLETFRSPRRLPTTSKLIPQVSRQGEAMDITVNGPIAYLSDVHGNIYVYKQLLGHVKGYVTIDCGNIEDQGYGTATPEEVHATLEASFEACGQSELFRMLNVGGEELKSYLRDQSIEEEYISLLNNPDTVFGLWGLYRKIFDSMHIEDIVAVEGNHGESEDEKTLIDGYLEAYPEVIFVKNQGIAVRHAMPYSYPTVTYKTTKGSEKRDFILHSSEASVFPPGFKKFTVEDKMSIDALEKMYSTRLRGEKHTKLAIAGHCHGEKPLLFTKKRGKWEGMVLEPGDGTKITAKSVLLVPGATDFYEKAYIVYSHKYWNGLFVWCKAKNIIPSRSVSEYAHKGWLNYDAGYLDEKTKERAVRLINQQRLAIGNLSAAKKKVNIDRFYRLSFVRAVLWDEMYYYNGFTSEPYMREAVRAAEPLARRSDGLYDLDILAREIRQSLISDVELAGRKSTSGISETDTSSADEPAVPERKESFVERARKVFIASFLIFAAILSLPFVSEAARQKTIARGVSYSTNGRETTIKADTRTNGLDICIAVANGRIGQVAPLCDIAKAAAKRRGATAVSAGTANYFVVRMPYKFHAVDLVISDHEYYNYTRGNSKNPKSNRPAFIVFEDNISGEKGFWIGNPEPKPYLHIVSGDKEKNIQLSGINELWKNGASDKVVIYNKHFDRRTKVRDGSFMAAIDPEGNISILESNSDIKVPPEGWVIVVSRKNKDPNSNTQEDLISFLSADGTKAAFRSEFGNPALEGKTVISAMRAGPTLIENSKIVIPGSLKREGFLGGPPRYRSAIGITAEGKVLLETVEENATYMQLAKKMEKHGAAWAICSDGGSSTDIYAWKYRGGGKILPHAIVITLEKQKEPQKMKSWIERLLDPKENSPRQKLYEDWMKRHGIQPLKIPYNLLELPVNTFGLGNYLMFMVLGSMILIYSLNTVSPEGDANSSGKGKEELLADILKKLAELAKILPNSDWVDKALRSIMKDVRSDDFQDVQDAAEILASIRCNRTAQKDRDAIGVLIRELFNVLRGNPEDDFEIIKEPVAEEPVSADLNELRLTPITDRSKLRSSTSGVDHPENAWHVKRARGPWVAAENENIDESWSKVAGVIPDLVDLTKKKVIENKMLLTPDQEKALARMIQNGNSAARRALIDLNKGLIHDLVKRALARAEEVGLTDEELYDVGMNGAHLTSRVGGGLNRAAELYDPDNAKDAKFGTYATHAIRNEINWLIHTRKKQRGKELDMSPENPRSVEFAEDAGNDTFASAFGDISIARVLKILNSLELRGSKAERNKEMFRQRLAGEDIVDIALLHNVTKQDASKQIKRVSYQVIAVLRDEGVDVSQFEPDLTERESEALRLVIIEDIPPAEAATIMKIEEKSLVNGCLREIARKWGCNLSGLRVEAEYRGLLARGETADRGSTGRQSTSGKQFPIRDPYLIKLEGKRENVINRDMDAVIKKYKARAKCVYGDGAPDECREEKFTVKAIETFENLMKESVIKAEIPDIRKADWANVHRLLGYKVLDPDLHMQIYVVEPENGNARSQEPFIYGRMPVIWSLDINAATGRGDLRIYLTRRLANEFARPDQLCALLLKPAFLTVKSYQRMLEEGSLFEENIKEYESFVRPFLSSLGINNDPFNAWFDRVVFIKKVEAAVKELGDHATQGPVSKKLGYEHSASLINRARHFKVNLESLGVEKGKGGPPAGTEPYNKKWTRATLKEEMRRIYREDPGVSFSYTSLSESEQYLYIYHAARRVFKNMSWMEVLGSVFGKEIVEQHPEWNRKSARYKAATASGGDAVSVAAKETFTTVRKSEDFGIFEYGDITYGVPRVYAGETIAIRPDGQGGFSIYFNDAELGYFEVLPGEVAGRVIKAALEPHPRDRRSTAGYEPATSSTASMAPAQILVKNTTYIETKVRWNRDFGSFNYGGKRYGLPLVYANAIITIKPDDEGGFSVFYNGKELGYFEILLGDVPGDLVKSAPGSFAGTRQSTAGDAPQATKTHDELFQDFKSTISTLGQSLVNNFPVITGIDSASDKAIILYADNVLEQGAAVDLEDVLSKTHILDNSTIIVYGKKPGTAGILERIIKEANSSVKVLPVEPRDLKERFNSAQDIDVEYPDETKELDCLIRYARVNNLNNGKLFGVIKGRTEDTYKDGINALLSEHKVPVASFESDSGLYSFRDALNMLVNIKNIDGPANNGWFKLLPPIQKLSGEFQKAYDNYKRALGELMASA